MKICEIVLSIRRDQNNFSEALGLFEEAMELRLKQDAPEDQIKSTERALARTKALLQN